MTTDPQDFELGFAELLDLASMWRDDRVRRGEDPPDVLSIARDPFFVELCTAAMRLGIGCDVDHEHWCGMVCEHSVDDIRSEGYGSAALDVKACLDWAHDAGVQPTIALRAWVKRHVVEVADDGE